MRALMYCEPGSMKLIERVSPTPGAGEALLQVKYCGICGTDVHAYQEGASIPRGTVMGHEIVGIVEQLGAGVAEPSRGTRVVVNPLPRCERCYWCQRGEYSLCEWGFSEEIGFHPEYPGGLADHLLIRHPDSMLVPLPENVSMEAAALVEPLATSLHALKKSHVQKGSSVLVLGAGMIGLGLVILLKLEGAGKIMVVEPSTIKAAKAAALGADLVIDPSKGHAATLEAVRSSTDGLGAEIVFECSGVAVSFREAPAMVRKGGQVILVGFCERDVTIRPIDWILKEIEMKAILGYYNEFKNVLEIMQQGKIPAGELITDIVQLEQADDRGFKRLVRDQNAVKILVDMTAAN